MASPRRGVLLIGMGGPRSPAEVYPFLRELFSDRDLIRLPLPAFLQRAIAPWIARRRTPKATARYARIGGGSPLVGRIEAQARALEARLGTDGEPWAVRAGMRYGSPSISEALARLLDGGAEEVVALPMYPQLSGTTTGSALNALRRTVDREAPALPWRRGAPFLAIPRYVDAFAGRIGEALATFREGGEGRLVFVAHSLPEKCIAQGDPYKDEVMATVEGVRDRLALETYEVAWQGQVGPMAWIGPTLEAVLERLARDGIRRVLVATTSFLFDHVETLVELDLEAAAVAGKLGFRGFERVAPFNDGEDLTAILEDLVRLEDWEGRSPRWKRGL